jgi:hypothetical protein
MTETSGAPSEPRDPPRRPAEGRRSDGSWLPTIDRLVAVATELLTPTVGERDAATLAARLIEELGVARLLAELHTAERIVTAADTYHPVASFFVDGSDERQLVLDVLRAAGRRVRTEPTAGT